MSASVQAAGVDSAIVRRRDWLIIALVGGAHACSHFFQLVLPTLYLSLAHEYGYDFAQLGLLASIFFLVSSIGQASSGFVVDRIGPVPVLHFGLICFALSGLLIAGSTGYAMLVLAAIIGGVGNAVFHPVDYSILNHRVSARRLGHGFSTHGLTGNLGWALTPVFMATLIHLFNWRIATLAAGGLIGVVLFFTWLGRDLLAGRNQAVDARSGAQVQVDTASSMGKDAVRGEAPAGAVPGAETRAEATVAPASTSATLTTSTSAGPDLSKQTAWQTLLTLLAQPALWGAFLFFMFSSIALSAVQNYTIPMLGQVYGIDKVLAGTTLSAYMLTAALGMLAGGFLVGATPNTERTVALSLVLAGLFLLLLASGAVPSTIAMVLVGLAGFCSGLAAPSRDMLIRRVTPKGATGTVYGLVYSGMDVGSSLAPAAFGLMLDAQLAMAPWVGAAVAFVAAAGLAMWVAYAASQAEASGLRVSTS